MVSSLNSLIFSLFFFHFGQRQYFKKKLTSIIAQFCTGNRTLDRSQVTFLEGMGVFPRILLVDVSIGRVRERGGKKRG